MTRIDTLKTIVSDHEAKLIDGHWVDPTTASMLVMVHGALSPANHGKFETLPLTRLVDFGLKHVRAA